MDQPYPEVTEDGYYTISFYSFFEIPEEKVSQLRDKIQKEWSENLGVVGRIYVCGQGINTQLSIPKENTQRLREWLEADLMFRGRIPRFNWAIEHRKAFKAFHVRVRPLVATGGPLDMETLVHEPQYLEPEEWDNELRSSQAQTESDSSSTPPLLIDMRNNYEARIGKFEGAVCPDVDTFRDEMNVVRDMCKDRSKSDPIYMYCTGGIRCSVAGAILKSEGYENVKTLRGGVIAYGKHVRERPDGEKSSLFKGKNFTFDKRLGEEVTAEVIAKCDQCGESCDMFTNCANTCCNLLFIQCPSCAAKHHNTCGSKLCIERAQLTHEELIKSRMPPLWDYHMRIHPEKVFGRDWIARVEKLVSSKS
ncbi:Rhodanese-like domain-containing protein [Coemansia spiralis]|nr:Rhodanese-like domain-containing protein [Coemansia spiralis]